MGFAAAQSILGAIFFSPCGLTVLASDSENAYLPGSAMGWLTKPRIPQDIHHAVGWAADNSAVFTTISLPGVGIARVLDKRVHLAALDSAGEKLSELVRRSGHRELV